MVPYQGILAGSHHFSSHHITIEWPDTCLVKHCLDVGLGECFDMCRTIHGKKVFLADTFPCFIVKVILHLRPIGLHWTKDHNIKPLIDVCTMGRVAQDADTVCVSVKEELETVM